MKNAYFDNASAAPVHPKVLEAMLPYLSGTFGNIQLVHRWGAAVRQAVDEAREHVAALIGGNAEEIIFTASGSESNNLVLKGLATAYQGKGKHIVVSSVEHFSVLYAVRTLEKAGFEVSTVPVDQHGRVKPADVARRLRDDTSVVSVMLANGEVGTIEPLREIVPLVKAKGILFHTDAVAAAGVVPIDVQALGVDALSLASNPIYGPLGVGALWLRRRTRLSPQIDGGVQEGGRRAGTENVPGIVGFGEAARLAKEQLAQRAERARPLRERLIEGISTTIDHTIVTGHRDDRLPNHASFCVEFIEGEAMLLFLSSKGIGASSGSACTSKALKASHVLSAMGVDAALAQGSLLFSINPWNTADEVEQVIAELPPIIVRLREMSPLYAEFREQGGQ
ncbi:MAG: cysteine desulfurase [Chloroflexota bacterium]|nr:MAG: cysteine desulfurase [Chloroflexota bacterium]